MSDTIATPESLSGQYLLTSSEIKADRVIVGLELYGSTEGLINFKILKSNITAIQPASASFGQYFSTGGNGYSMDLTAVDIQPYIKVGYNLIIFSSPVIARKSYLPYLDLTGTGKVALNKAATSQYPDFGYDGSSTVSSLNAQKWRFNVKIVCKYLDDKIAIQRTFSQVGNYTMKPFIKNSAGQRVLVVLDNAVVSVRGMCF